MFFFNKPLICYLSSTSLHILSSTDQKFAFSPELVQHSELVDPIKFESAFLQFLNQLTIKGGKGIIVLAPEIVFSGEINRLNQSGDNPVEQFLSSVPLARDTISSVQVKNKNTETIYVTNRRLYEVVVKVLSQKNIGIYSVVPVTALQEIPSNEEINIEEIKKKVGNKKIITEYNFLRTKLPEEVPTFQNNSAVDIQAGSNKTLRKQYIILSLSLLLLTGAVAYLLLSSGIIGNPWFKKDSDVSSKIDLFPTPPSTASAQPSPSTKAIDKSSLKIQVLNGSGIEGQAGKLSLILQESGYQNITIGNATNSEQFSKMIYSKDLSVDIPKGLADTLKSALPNIELQEASQSANFDVVITTGSEQ